MFVLSNIFVLLVIVVGIIIGVVFLQVFLSKKDSRWFGIIIPAISFFISILIVISIVAYTNIGITSHSTSENGTIIKQEIEDSRSNFVPVVIQAVTTFLIFNIPTVVLISIYAACREKRRRRLDLEKMQIQDLE